MGAKLEILSNIRPNYAVAPTSKHRHGRNKPKNKTTKSPFGTNQPSNAQITSSG